MSQYRRFTGEFETGKNIKQVLNRALQFAPSDPKEPVYVVGAREVMEEEISPYKLDQFVWQAVSPTALPHEAVQLIVATLAAAEKPLIIVGYSERNHATASQLVRLAKSISGTRALDALGSDVCFPYTHRASLGVRIGKDASIEEADAIIFIDCDVPWIPTQCRPRADAKIIHIDVDPLKQNMPLHYISAFRRYRADAETALLQMNAHISQHPDYATLLSQEPYITRWESLGKTHEARMLELNSLAQPSSEETLYPTTSFLVAELRRQCPEDAIWCIEAVTNAMPIYNQLRIDEPGHLVNCGGGGLGWSGGATLGVKLAADHLAKEGMGKGKFVCEIVGDGTYLFGCPGTVYWVARRYELPTLTVILSNKGNTAIATLPLIALVIAV